MGSNPYYLGFVTAPQLSPDPPGPGVQFSISWRHSNTGDTTSPWTQAWADVYESDGSLKISSVIDLRPLDPQQETSETIGVGSLSSGSWRIDVTLDKTFGNGEVAVIPLNV